ncbi:Cytochrome P450 [Geosmithia morbida]|uniref:Cytochrome P450 n=1 Tax=Geosmithia morbida TaxID=1094350 RepID=A0A9P4YS72_9HYPO|nr:Cytochrome P450 [Geosmithia morbida]KAF4122151.1 Cytochrome P450 [Geosmithia morbida]
MAGSVMNVVMENMTESAPFLEKETTIIDQFNTSIFVSGVCFMFAVGYYAYASRDPYREIPELNPRRPFEFSDTRRARDFIKNTFETFSEGKRRFGSNPYRLFSDTGAVLVLPDDFVEEIRSDKRFDFSTGAGNDAHNYIPGFEPFGIDDSLQKIVNKYLTKALGTCANLSPRRNDYFLHDANTTEIAKVTAPLSQEAGLVIHEVIGEETDWHSLNVQETIMAVIARMSSRVFMGEELCRNKAWTDISARYTLEAFKTGDILREYPPWMRSWVHWFLPGCQNSRRLLQEARETIKPYIVKRRQIKAEALARGKKVSFDDAIEWLEATGSRLDAATGQVMLSLVAIHTTTDLLQQTMTNIASHPDLFEPLRQEIVSVLSTDGLKKAALNSLKLMDSVIKESQRLKPVSTIWRRYPTEDVTLSNGFKIKKNTRIIVNNMHMWDEKHYDNPEQFDGYRFFRMRQTPEEGMAHLVSTSRKHMGFGHGTHSCPGRFFGANEIKIALSHLLLKYDWKLCGEPKPIGIAIGMTYGSDPTSELEFRRRESEFDIDSLVTE